jgi:putative addiction module CopG family antidote
VPTFNVNLSPELEDLVLSRVESGRYSSASEMMQAALRALRREEQARKAKRSETMIAADASITADVAKADPYRKLWLAQTQSQQMRNRMGQ